MENMTAVYLNTRALTVDFRVANRAIIITSLTSCKRFIFIHAFRVQAWQALLFSFETTASMTAR
jgi:hypothetical protein